MQAPRCHLLEQVVEHTPRERAMRAPALQDQSDGGHALIRHVASPRRPTDVTMRVGSATGTGIREYRRVGRSPLSVSERRAGTMPFGNGAARRRADRSLSRAREAGVNFVEIAAVPYEAFRGVLRGNVRLRS